MGFLVNHYVDRIIVMFKILFFIVVSLIFLGCSSSPADKAVEELTSHYRSSDIYENTYCRSREVNGSTFILCTPDDSDPTYIGGMYQLEYGKDGAYAIYTLNGKAMQHVEGYSIAKERYGSDINVDITEIRKYFD